MSNTTDLKILNELKKNQTIEVCGWVKTFRANRFIALNDGSSLENIQCVIDFENTDDNILKKITTGSSVKISGKIVESTGAKQAIEIQVNKIDILGESNPDQYPIQPKKHSFEFLRENAHLRTRTSTFNAIMRLRSSLSFAIHKFF
jgi:asparaginyl-tRNA synthetase